LNPPISDQYALPIRVAGEPPSRVQTDDAHPRAAHVELRSPAQRWRQVAPNTVVEAVLELEPVAETLGGTSSSDFGIEKSIDFVRRVDGGPPDLGVESIRSRLTS
jgi:hypothetical protein